MSKIIINQFHSGSAYGDAVTNSLFYTQKILQELGFESEIYCEHVAPELKDKILHYSKYKTSQKNILLLHHSMGHDLDEWILNLKDKIVLVYHNITPHDFFPRESPFYHYSLKGREQLEMFKKISHASIGDSKLNVDELLDSGFSEEKTKVIPLLIEYDKVKNHPWNHLLFDANAKTYNILFVGRIAPNKGQFELIELFAHFRKLFLLPSKLFLVGGTTDKNYEQSLHDLIKEKNLQDSIHITGKIPYEDLYAYYRVADVFVCLSEHEGFGVPLIEAMIFDAPVVAYDSSNIKNTLGGSGVLFKEKNLRYMAGFLSLLSKNRALKRAIIKTQRENLLDFQHNKIKYDLAQFLNNQNLTSIDLEALPKTDSLQSDAIQIEGPFDSSYSLALLNREMAKTLEKIKPDTVSLFSTEGLGDFEPNQTFLKQNPLYDTLFKRAKKAKAAAVVLRNLYPPRVYDAKGLINLTNSYGWEESSFPQNYIQDFNRHLDALPVMSRYVQKVMIDNGLLIPAPVVGVGVDHMLGIEPKEYKLKTKKRFKFLHISSCFPRKGIDVLLKAYESAFTLSDDVCLVIKTFPNPHNNIEELLKNHKTDNKNFPEIELINQDLEDAFIVNLYKQCSALAAPSRGEGFGLPMAEAMLFDMPVITTGFGGQCDFCTNETSWLIDYTFEKAQTHMNLFNSYWAEPSSEHLAQLMKLLHAMPKEEIEQKSKKAKENILANHKWEHSAVRVLDVVSVIEASPIFSDKKTAIGWVSTYNTKCGIATYSELLLNHFDEELFDIKILANHVDKDEIINPQLETDVYRIFNNASDKTLNPLYDTILQNNLKTVVIQFNFGFFNLTALGELLEKLHAQGVNVYITLHSVKDVDKPDFKASLSWIVDSLEKVKRIFVHNIDDLNILKSFGLVENVSLFPHGVQKREQGEEKSLQKKEELSLNGKVVISSYGFMLPHKGIKELIEAFSILRNNHKNLYLLLVNAIYPNPISNAYADECNKIIKESGLSKDVTMINDFLSDNDSFTYLDCSDILVMPYRETQESSSAAVRYALSTNKPVVCTPISIFNDVSDIVHFSQDVSAQSLARKIDALLQNPKLLNAKDATQKEWIQIHDWREVSTRLQNIISNTQS
ncbi:MAG: glycosyltransferase [Campylobacterales bacterium]|nr:glycosyltransferase [Campylobacterales bacterium]